jgi:hypothetical protein
VEWLSEWVERLSALGEPLEEFVRMPYEFAQLPRRFVEMPGPIRRAALLTRRAALRSRTVDAAAEPRACRSVAQRLYEADERIAEEFRDHYQFEGAPEPS